MSEKIEIDIHQLPSVDELLRSNILTSVIDRFGHDVVRDEARNAIDELRKQILAKGKTAPKNAGTQSNKQATNPALLLELSQLIERKVTARFTSTMKSVFNLTGTVVHTNLGRSPLPDTAISAMTKAAAGPVNLEFNLETGKRGDRDSHLEALICEVTGAEAATVVNNNAAAVLLILTSLAVGKDVLISRGELVEIGGSFRIPEVMGSAGCHLKEVGATNRTHLADFETAVDAETALVMKVHTSNYEIRGFTKEVESADLAALAKERGLYYAIDLGSGTLVDLQQYGLPFEPTVQSALASGADLVSFSGDKLLGGPQAGIIVGKKELIQKLKSNPLKRALRVDKVTLAALLEVIYLYRDEKSLPRKLPILRDLTRPAAEIAALANELLPKFIAAIGQRAELRIVPCRSQIGSGALPLELLESFAIEISPKAEKGQTDATLQALASAFRNLPIPVIGRISDGCLLFDLRCLHQTDEFCAQLSSLDG